MSKNEDALLQEETKAILRSDFVAFTEKTFHHVDPGAEYLPNWHIELIGEYLQACQSGEINRLIINIPPRHMKSISIAIAFPAWLLGHNPSEQIMCASYSQELSFKHSIDCRLVVESEWYKWIFPDTIIADDQNTKRKFITTERGYRIATSVGGTSTGEGGNFLIVDDPISAAQSESEVMRNNANLWFERTFSTRLNNKNTGCIIIVMQRFHEEDLTGHLLKKGGWEHLCLPLIAEESSVVQKGKVIKKREVGDILHPQRMSTSVIEQTKIDLGPYGFAGQYQQNPAPLGGGIFQKNWIVYYDSIDHSSMNKYILVDPANSKTKTNDFTAIIVLGAHQDGNLYILDMVRDKLNVKEREDTIFALHQKYKPQLVAYEKYGMQVDIDWIKKSMEDRNYRFRIEEVGGSLKKEDRIRRLVKYFYDGKLYFPRIMYKTNYENKLCDLVDDFIQQEYLCFPVGKHDDLIDALSRLCDINIIYPNNNAIDYHKIYGSH